MTDLRTAAQQALEAMRCATPTGKITLTDWYKSITALRAALAEPVQEPVACSNTFGCQCPKHFASQQLEQRPKRVLTAVWRDRARRAEAQRDALLEALKTVEWHGQGSCWVVDADKIAAAIKAAEENT